MLIAVNTEQNRVWADEADREQDYFCPICGEAVRLRRGEVKVPHFAHKSGNCRDSWRYDMTEWHKSMQEFFPVEAHEVIVRFEGEVHRADVLIGNTVIELQHSPITAKEFEARNCFFRKAGYRLAWVFDFREKVKQRKIASDGEKELNHLYEWSNPVKIFSVLDVSDICHSEKFSVFVQLYDDAKGFVEKVVNTTHDWDGIVSFSRFVTGEIGIELGDPALCVDDMFLSQEELRKKILKSAIGMLREQMKEGKFGYRIKYIGEKGKNRDAYICPRTNQFGVKAYSEDGCAYCKYCHMVVRKYERNSGRHKIAIYCCYPKQVREVLGELEGHPGYECNQADEYWL